MNKSEVVNLVADRTSLSRAQAEEAISALIDTVAEAVSAGDRVLLSGLGTFERRLGSARTGRNPQTNTPMRIPPRFKVRFNPSTAFRRMLDDAMDEGAEELEAA